METQHIFFDDNASPTDHCILDCRDLITGEHIPTSKSQNMYYVKVNPQRAIQESDYFLKCIEECVANRDEDIRAHESTSLVQVQPSAWDAMQQLPDEEYLLKTVLPVLYQGMKVVDMQRPEAPLEYLALYLLKN